MSLPRISTWASASPRDRKDVTVHPGFSASYLALWGLVIFQSLVVLALLRELAELHTVTERHALAREVWLPLGTEAPQFTAADRRSGRPVSTQELSGTGGVILFLSTGCSACETLVASLKRAVAGDLPAIIALCRGAEEPCGTFVTSEIPLILVGAAEAAAHYRVSGFPTAVVVDGQGKIRGYGHPQSAVDLKTLVATSLGELTVSEGTQATALSPGLSQS